MEALLEQISILPGAMPPEQHTDGWWMSAPDIDVQALAGWILSNHVRLATVTASASADGETVLIYHCSIASLTLNIKTITRDGSIPSMAPVLPAANWIEREIHDLFSVNFTGHPNLERLIRPPEVPEGFFRQPGGAASHADQKPSGEERNA